MTHANEIRHIMQKYNTESKARFNRKLENTCNRISIALEERAGRGKTTYVTRIKDKYLAEEVMRNFGTNGYEVYQWPFGFVQISWA